jgi:hypothetical protein
MPVLDTGIQGRQALRLLPWIAGSSPAMTSLQTAQRNCPSVIETGVGKISGQEVGREIGDDFDERL